MQLTSSKQRRIVAWIVSAVCVFLAWFTGEPASLLVVVAATSICIGWKQGLLAVVATTLIAAAIISHDAALSYGYAKLIGFIAASSGIWFVIKLFRTVSFYDRVYQGDAPNMADIPGLGWSAYPDGRLRFVNPAALEYVGLTAEEMREVMDANDFSWATFIHPDDVENSKRLWAKSMETGEPLRDEQRVRRADGTYRWFRDIGVASRDDRGRIIGWYGHTEDIDDQRKAEAALRQSERELRVLVDTVPTMIWLMTPEGLPYYFNQRFVEWAGIDPIAEPSVSGHQFATHVELFHPDDRAAVKRAFAKAFASGKSLQHKARLCRKDGHYRWIDSRFEPLRDEHGLILRWYGVNFDIDEEVRAQEALRLADDRLSRALRAASLSEFSVSIAHELNQPLQAVVANAGAFQRWLSAKPPSFENASRVAEKIIRNADAAAQVIARIRALFSKSSTTPVPIDLNHVVTEVCELLTDKFQASGVSIDFQLDPSLPAPDADRVQMEQVVLNLVQNGIEAMADIPGSARKLTIVSRELADQRVQVEVRDCGRGLQDLERMFEAFYTTKKDGMGMGLAICRSIIESHGGRLWAEPLPQGGASVAFSLPMRASNEAERDAQAAA